jgi:hypothetical protein
MRVDLDALAIGIMLALLVELVLRLTSSASVGLALIVTAIDRPELRTPVATHGAVVIQNLITAVLFGTFLVALRFPASTGRDQPAEPLLRLAAVGLGVLADGVITASARASSNIGQLLGLALVCGPLGFAVACAFGRSGLKPRSVALAGCAISAAGVAGYVLGRAVGFQAANVAATPLLLVSTLLLVLTMAARLSGPRAPGAISALIGFGLQLGAWRLLAAGA